MATSYLNFFPVLSPQIQDYYSQNLEKLTKYFLLLRNNIVIFFVNCTQESVQPKQVKTHGQ